MCKNYESPLWYFKRTRKSRFSGTGLVPVWRLNSSGPAFIHQNPSLNPVWKEKNSAASWLLQPPATHLTQPVHSNSCTGGRVSLAARWLHSEAWQTKSTDLINLTGLVRFNCIPESPLGLLASQHGHPLRFYNEIYAIAVFQMQIQCQNPGKWRGSKGHITGRGCTGTPSAQ